MNDRLKANLVEGSEWFKLLLLALPVIAWMVGSRAFPLIEGSIAKLSDGYEVGFASAMTFNLTYLNTIPILAFAVAVGAALSRAIGEGKERVVKRIITDSFLFALVLSIILPLIGQLMLEPYLSAMGPKDFIKGEVLAQIRQYMIIWHLGLPLLTLSLVGSYALLAVGNGWLPSLIMIVNIIINLALDFILIGGLNIFPSLGLNGIALAALIARLLTAFIPLLCLALYYKAFTLAIPQAGELWDSCKRLLPIWLAALFIQLIFVFYSTFLTVTISKHGAVVLAGSYTVIGVQTIVLAPLIALSMAVLVFSGQNMGAARAERVGRGYLYANIASLIFGGLAAVGGPLLFFIFSHLLEFSSQYTAIALPYLIALSFSFAFEGVIMNTTMLFYGCRRSLFAFLLNLGRIVLFNVPLIFLGSHLFKLTGIGVGISLSAFYAAALAWLWGWLFLRGARPAKSVGGNVGAEETHYE